MEFRQMKRKDFCNRCGLGTKCLGSCVFISVPEMITIRFASWMSGRIVSFQTDPDIQKLLSNGNRIRISETLLSIFRGFRLLEKVAHCTIIHLLFSEASFQPSVPWLRVCLWCNLCTVVWSHSPLNLLIGHANFVSMNLFLVCQDRALSVYSKYVVCCVPGL